MEPMALCSAQQLKSRIEIMKKFIIMAAITIAAYNIFMEIDDIVHPSDSGDMMWLNYQINKHMAENGNVRSKMKMLSYYLYNDPLGRDLEIKKILMEIFEAKYGGKNNGGDSFVIEITNRCQLQKSVSPTDVQKAFKTIQFEGGGLTEQGQIIYEKWKNGEFAGCPYID